MEIIKNGAPFEYTSDKEKLKNIHWQAVTIGLESEEFPYNLFLIHKEQADHFVFPIPLKN